MKNVILTFIVVALCIGTGGCASAIATDYSGKWTLSSNSKGFQALPAATHTMDLNKNGSGTLLGVEGTWTCDGSVLKFTEGAGGAVSLLNSVESGKRSRDAVFTVHGPTRLEWKIDGANGSSATIAASK